MNLLARSFFHASNMGPSFMHLLFLGKMHERKTLTCASAKQRFSSSQALLSHWGSWGLLLCTCFPKPQKKVHAI